jgi:hypothetical protein
MAERDVPKPFPSGDELPDYDPDELRDPDADFLPAGLEELDGEPVTVTGIDRATGELVREAGVVATVPGLHGDLARREQR